MITNCILNDSYVRMWDGLNWLRIGSSVEYREHSIGFEEYISSRQFWGNLATNSFSRTLFHGLLTEKTLEHTITVLPFPQTVFSGQSRRQRFHGQPLAARCLEWQLRHSQAFHALCNLWHYVTSRDFNWIRSRACQQAYLLVPLYEVPLRHNLP